MHPGCGHERAILYRKLVENDIAMPMRFIHSMSLRAPSQVMLPFIQCHQTRGCADSGGARKLSNRRADSLCGAPGSAGCACAALEHGALRRIAIANERQQRIFPHKDSVVITCVPLVVGIETHTA